MKIEITLRWFYKNQIYKCLLENLQFNLTARNLLKLRNLIEVFCMFNYDFIHKDSKMDLILNLDKVDLYVTMYITPFYSNRQIEIFYQLIDNYGMFWFLLDSKYWIVEGELCKKHLKLSKFYIPKIKYVYKKRINKNFHIYDLYDENRYEVGQLELLTL